MASKLTLAEVPLLIGGLFMVYLAVLDETLFNFVLDNVTQNQFTVSLATVIAAALPMFFAVGFIKRSVLRRWQTIYYYEKMLLGEVFWILTVILLNIITFIIVSEQGVHQFNAPILAGCVLFSIYLVIYSFKTRQKSYP
jgi:ACR3 family arsenite efflux pump ArsB